MYIYNGKLNWYEYAKNECITFVFPASFSLNDPVCAYWQWTVDGAGVKKSNSLQFGTITSVTTTSDQYNIVVSFEYYSFEGVVASDFQSVTVTMRNPQGERNSATNLQIQSSDAVRVPSTEVFTGKLNWWSYAQNEMITLVVPSGITNGAPVGFYHEWTVDGAGHAKSNHSVNATLSSVSTSANGNITGRFTDGYYTYQATWLSGGKEATVRMSNPSGDNTTNNMKHTDFRSLGTKKALIVRFGTGTDNGIFLVREMLNKHLGFAIDDVELMYFDVEPSNGRPGQTNNGQDPPTATRFKNKFTELISKASPGDVRFLYVDAHGTTYPDEDGSGETDGNDEGWILAENDQGTGKVMVLDDWLAKAIRNNLAKVGVNLTILTSSCMGGGMLDTHTATPGVLLAGCHETQFNVKALRTSAGLVDPWVLAVTTVIKNQVKRKRGVPSYSALFNDAKKFIKQQLDGGNINSRYKGPSTNELAPIPRDQESNTSNQDPQLIFFSGYFDPDEERFLFPFVAPHGGEAKGEATRFPRDEYPHDEL